MLKTVLLASAIIVSVPAFAQDMTKPAKAPRTAAPVAPAPAATTPVDTTMPDTTAAPDSAAMADTAAPQSPAPTLATDAQTAQTPVQSPARAAAPAQAAAAPTDASAKPAETAATSATPVTGAAQIAQVVSTEFPSYDKNADGNLDKTEFGAWMVALKTASDPTTKPDAPATVTWVSGAFASADTDKSKAVSQAELTTYLSRGA